MADNVIISVLTEAGRTAEDKDLERQFKIACKKLGVNPKQNLQEYMRKVIAASKKKTKIKKKSNFFVIFHKKLSLELHFYEIFHHHFFSTVICR